MGADEVDAGPAVCCGSLSRLKAKCPPSSAPGGLESISKGKAATAVAQEHHSDKVTLMRSGSVRMLASLKGSFGHSLREYGPSWSA